MKADKCTAKKESFFIEVAKAPSHYHGDWEIWKRIGASPSWGIVKRTEPLYIIVVDKKGMKETDNPIMWMFRQEDMRRFIGDEHDKLLMKSTSAGWGKREMLSWGYIVPIDAFINGGYALYRKNRDSDNWKKMGRGSAWKMGKQELFQMDEDAQYWKQAAKDFPELKEAGCLQ